MDGAGYAQRIVPAKSGRESWGRERNSAGDARERALAKCRRQRQCSVEGGAGIARQRSLALCSAPALSTALRRHYPPPCAGTIHRPAPVLSSALRRHSPRPVPALFLHSSCTACTLPRTAPAPSSVLCSRSPPHCTGAPARVTLALDFALRRHSLLQHPGVFH